MSNQSHSLTPPSGNRENTIARAKAVAYNAADTAFSLAEMIVGAGVASTGLGAALGGAAAFHGGLSFSQASARLLGSVAMSMSDYQRLEAQTSVVSGVGVIVLIGEGIWSASTGSPYDIERAQDISDFGNSLVDIAGLMARPDKVSSTASKFTVATAAGLKSWNLFKGYSTLFKPLMNNSQSEQGSITRIPEYRPPTATQWRSHIRERESPQDRAIREIGGMPRVNDRDFNREIQRQQIDRPRIDQPGRPDKSYFA